MSPGRLAADGSLPATSQHAEERPVEFEALARAHRAPLEAFALRICRDPSEAHDLVQDTLERALRAFDANKAATNPRAWLFAILHNRFIDRCRKRRREAVEDIEDHELSAPEAPEPPRWAAITPAELHRAVDELEEEFRVVYRMHALEGRSYLEVSAAVGVPVNTVGTRLARARRKLRSILEERFDLREEASAP